ncbi:amidohydrolase family protein [Oscillatoria sp. FACHB-1407]|uniref:amidohydrolase family protein n=1 Tax=Oscillatoria sp. FACHB-1407 TaxID=2692847 RepID=UPI0016874410|nr:amidohydrolase family protein [Oscillatoria sp. FACHB-1407]MBD2463588.1 amidohydrolase family protein [Oscillatoria sp. FACHB-1407]
MADIVLVRGRWIFTGETTLTDGAIAIQNDTIVEVGSWASLRASYPNAEVLGSEQFAIMPGLINAHHHSNGVPNLLQGVDDDFLELWLFANVGLRSQDPTLKTLLSIARLLQSGVTTVVDVSSVSGTVEDCWDTLKGQLQAYEQAGMRVALTPGVSYTSFFVHEEDDAFLATLPQDLLQRLQSLVPVEPHLTQNEYLDLITDLVKRYQSHPHVDIWFGPPGPQWVGDKLLVQIADTANRLNTQVQTHAVESFYEKLLGPRFYGKSVIAHLNELGVLSPRFSIAHGVWLTETDIEILASTGAAVSHNPGSNLRLRAGIAPLNALLASGVTVGLGMDGTTLGDDEDMFAEMRLAARLHRTPQLNTPAPSYDTIFHLATMGGARLMGQQHIGKLAPGYKADVVLVRSDRFTWPWLAPEADPLHVMLLRAKAADVDTVLINGKVVLQGGMPTGFDLHAVGQELADQLNAAPNPDPYRALVVDMLPHLTRWYNQWEVPHLMPYAAFNSRI